MNQCEAVSDRTPAVAAGRSEWTAAEQAHLAACPDCAAEWKLVTVSTGLGRDITVDTARVTPVVLERVRAAGDADQRSRWVRSASVVSSLAVAALLLLVLVPKRGPVSLGPMGVAGADGGDLQLAELDDAAPAELEMVLVGFDEPAEPASSLDGPDLEGLDMPTVESALRSWEES